MASRTAGPGTHTAGQVLTAVHMNNLPGGWIGYVETTADSATYTTTLVDISGLSQAVTVNTNRRIKVTVDLAVDHIAEAEVSDIFIREGSTSLKKHRAGGRNGSAQSSVHFHVILTPSSGSHTYKVSAQRQTGTGSHKILADSGTTWGPASILISDEGPSS